jgi:hypothetical protein
MLLRCLDVELRPADRMTDRPDKPVDPPPGYAHQGPPLPPPAPLGYPPPDYPPGYQQPPQYPASPYAGGPPIIIRSKTNGFAIAALVLGIVWIYWIGSILALVFGYIAKSQIDSSGGEQTGRGMAIAGIVLGWIGVGILLLLILAIAFGAGSVTVV